MPNTINLRLLDNKNIIAEMNGIPLAQENSYKIIAGEENATKFAIASRPAQYEMARYTVEMVNSQGYGIEETAITQDTFGLPKGMAVAGYGIVQIRAYQGEEEVPFMPLKVKVWNTIPNWKEHIKEPTPIPTDKEFNYRDYNVPIVELTGNVPTMKDQEVSLNYVYGDKSGTCTLKWQGSSSLSYPKKNYTIKFDTAFEAKNGWGSQKKYCLKADWIDFSHCRNVCSAKLWGEIVKSRQNALAKLTALPNGGAIDGFPCFVVINGEWQGIYNFNIPKDGWMMGMSDNVDNTNITGEWQINTSALTAYFDSLGETYSAGWEVNFVDKNGNEYGYISFSKSGAGWGELVFMKDIADMNPTFVWDYGATISDNYANITILSQNSEVTNASTLITFLQNGATKKSRDAILCAEGTNNIFRAEATASKEDGAHFAIEHSANGFTDSAVQNSLNRLIRACINSDGTDIDTTIARYLDINSAIDYFIFVVALKGIDIYMKNYILATYDGVKWFFSAYDLDSTWGLYWDGKSFERSGYLLDRDNISQNTSFWSLTYNNNTHRVFELLYKYKKPEIIARYNELRKSILTVSNVSDIVREYAKQIPFASYEADNVKWGTIPSTGSNNPNQICEWVIDRLKAVDEEIERMTIQVEEQPTLGIKYSQKDKGNFSADWHEALCEGVGSASDTEINIASYVMLQNASSGIYVDGLPVTTIGKEAFSQNAQIKKVKIPKTVKEIREKAFVNCTSLSEVEIPESVTTIKQSAFNNCPLTSLKIPQNVIELQAYFNYNNKILTTLSIPNKVEKIGQAAFYNTNALKKLKLSNRLKTIEKQAFGRMSVLDSTLVIPKSVETIGESAFTQAWKCPKLVFKGTPKIIFSNAFVDFGQNVKDSSGNVISEIYVPFDESTGMSLGAPWGATATIHYNADVENVEITGGSYTESSETTEEWVFILEDGSTVTKNVVVK